MMRALIELLVIIIFVIGVRAVLQSLFRGVASSSGVASRKADPPPVAGELHKDPVCGTYVASTTSFRRTLDGRTFYYCSAACRDRHHLAA